MDLYYKACICIEECLIQECTNGSEGYKVHVLYIHCTCVCIQALVSRVTNAYCILLLLAIAPTLLYSTFQVALKVISEDEESTSIYGKSLTHEGGFIYCNVLYSLIYILHLHNQPQGAVSISWRHGLT